MTHRRIPISWPILGLILTATVPAVAQTTVTPPASDAATRSEAAVVQAEWEDVLLLEALQSLRLSDAQWEKVFSLARGVRDRLRQADTEEAGHMLRLKETVAASRQRLVSGGKVAPTTQEQLRLAREVAIQRRTRLEADLARTTSDQLARILAPAQMEIIYSLTRNVNLGGVIVSPLLKSRAMGGLRAGRSPEEEYQYQRKGIDEDLRDWRKDGHPDERADLIREMTRGIPRDTPQYRQANAQAGIFVEQVKAMPEAAFQQQVNSMSDLLARGSVAGRQREDRAKFLAAKTPAEIAQWLEPFVRRVFFSPRIVPALEARLGPPSHSGG